MKRPGGAVGEEKKQLEASEVFDLKPTSGDSGVRIEFVGWRPSRNCWTNT
jgi:hypothetical protein